MSAPGRRDLARGTALLATLPVAARAEGARPGLDIAGMTWPEVRDAVAAGKRTVIVPTGGLEQNGPHMIIGKHDHIVRFAARRIAEELGDALTVPVLPFVPQGRFVPPEGHLRFPGTIGVSEDAFAGMLDGIARSLRGSGFRFICFLGDHGASQRPQAAVASRLTSEWRRQGVRVITADRYYAAIAEQDAWLRSQGETEAAIGTHAGIEDTSELMSVHPDGVMLSRLPPRPADLVPLGATGDPSRSSVERGEHLLAIRIAAAVAQIRAARGS